MKVLLFFVALLSATSAFAKKAQKIPALVVPPVNLQRVVVIKNDSRVTILEESAHKNFTSILNRIDELTAPLLSIKEDRSPCVPNGPSLDDATLRLSHSPGPKSPQALELFDVFIISKNGRVEAANIRNEKLMSDKEVPSLVLDDPVAFYDAFLFEQARREGQPVSFVLFANEFPHTYTEHAQDLNDLGATWYRKNAAVVPYLTRLRVVLKPPVVDDKKKNEDPLVLSLKPVLAKLSDIQFREVPERPTYAVQFRTQKPFYAALERRTRNPAARCREIVKYKKNLIERLEKEANTLAALTGWNIQGIRKRMDLTGRAPKGSVRRWFERLWQEWSGEGSETDESEEVSGTESSLPAS